MPSRLDRNVHRDMSWLVYFNGVQVPAIQVSTRTAPNQISTAEVTLPPSRYLKGLGRGDRVRCTVFYLDHYGYTEPRWCLLFDGEIVAQAKRRTEQGKFVSFHAVDFMAILNRFFPFFVQNVSDIVTANTQTQQSAVSTPTVPFPTATVLFNDIKRPYDLLRNILALLRGEGVAPDQASVVATDFFKPWAERTQIVRRILPSQEHTGSDDFVFPLVKAVQSQSVLDAVQKLADKFGSANSYGVLVRQVYQHMLYALTSVLAPPAMLTNADTAYIYGPATGPNNLADAATDLGHHIGQYLCHSRVHFGIPPRFNVLWPSMVTDVSYRENFAEQPTRTYIGNFHLFNTVDRGRNGAMKQIVDKALTVGYPLEAQYQLERHVEREGKGVNINNYLVYPEEFFKGPVYNNLQTPAWYLMLRDSARGENDRSVLKLYAALEHYKARYSKRSCSVEAVFNPYIVPGFPIAILDSPGEDSDHFLAEAVEIRHTLGQDVATTTVSCAHTQPLDEMYELLADQILEHTTVYSDSRSAPFNPIESLRQRFQTYDGATEFYRRIFYHKDESVDPLLKLDDLFLVRSSDGSLKAPYYGYNEDGVNVWPDEETGEVPQYVYNENYRPQIYNYEEAMRWSARPVCTLEQYIDYHKERGLRDSPQGERGRTYYVRILDINEGPGLEPGQFENGDRCGEVGVDTKRNWTQRLLRFRRDVVEKRHRQ